MGDTSLCCQFVMSIFRHNPLPAGGIIETWWKYNPCTKLFAHC